MTAPTAHGFEVFGYVRFIATPSGEPSELNAYLDFTDETAERNPEWKLDICDEAVGTWRGPSGSAATMTLVWGHPLVSGGRVATAELGGITVDQCELVSERFTLLAPDDFRGDLLEIQIQDLFVRHSCRARSQRARTASLLHVFLQINLRHPAPEYWCCRSGKGRGHHGAFAA